MLVAIAIPVFTSQLERSRDAVTVSNIRAAYAEAQTAYLTQQSDTANGVTYDASGTNTTVTVTGIVAKGTQDGWSGTTEDLVIKSQVEAASNGCAAMANTAGTYKLVFTYDGNGSISSVAATATP